MSTTLKPRYLFAALLALTGVASAVLGATCTVLQELVVFARYASGLVLFSHAFTSALL